MWDRFKMWFFDKLSVDRNMPCHAFGGVVKHTKPPAPPAYRIRVCTKNRWHIDSHAYEFLEYPYKYYVEED